MPDFNLMAEIDIQLASNAAEKLAASANKALKGVMADVKIEPIIKKNAYMERVFPGGNKLTRIKVGFEISEAQKKILERALPKGVKVPVTIETKLDSKGLDFKALVEELKNTRLSFQVRNSDKTLSFLEDLNTKIKNLLSDDKNDRIKTLMRSLDLFSKIGVQKLSRLAGKVSGEEVQVQRNTQVRDLAKQSKAAKKDVGALEKELLEIEAIDKRRRGQPDTFLRGLTSGLQDALDVAKKLSGTGRGSQIEADKKLNTMFGGLNDRNARSNATAAYTEIFKGLNEVYRIQQKMSSLTTDKDLLKQFTEQAQTAADKLKKLFIDPNVVSGGKNVTSVAVKNLVSDLRIMQTETENFRKGTERIRDEISGLRGKGDVGSDAIIVILEKRLGLLQKLIGAGKTYSQALENDQVKQTYSAEARAKSASVLLEQFKTTLQKTRTGLEESDAFKTEAASATDLSGKVQQLIQQYERFIAVQGRAGAQANKESIVSARERFRVDLDDYKAYAKTTQGFFDSLNNKISYYSSDNLGVAKENTQFVKQKILSLVKAGAGISEITARFNELNQSIEVNAKNEKGLRKFEDALLRLQDSFKFGITFGKDEVGVQSYISKQIDQLRSAGVKTTDTGFKTVGDLDLRRSVSEASYVARSMQKINDTIENARQKLQEKIFESGGDSFKQVRQVYESALVSLDKYVAKIGNLSNDTGRLKQAHAELKQQIDATFQVASIKAMGGSIGEFTKAVGLAAKRLSAFLFAATPIYTLTSAIRQSAGEVVGLDKQFTKLTQILAGNGQNMKSAQEQSDQLAKSILNLGKAYGNSTVEIAESADVLAQAGIQGRDLAAILETVSKARLGPTFGSAEQISESIIATMNQFEIPARQMEGVIGGISQVAAQFPVEADGITKAIRRAGGAFAASTAQGQSYMDSLGDFVGAFTVLKGKTREADETLATSLRNVLTRLQRVSIQRFLKNRYQINLLDTQNQFVGFNEAIGKIVKRLDELGIASGDPRFAEIFEKISGPRQISRVLSLVKSFGEAKTATESFKSGASSLDRDVGIAFDSIENKLGRAKAAVVDLFTELGRSPVFKSLVDGFTLVTQAITSTLSAVTGLIESFGVIGRLGAVATLGNLGASFLRTRLSQSGLDLAGVGNSFGNSFLGRKARPIVDIVGMNSGGLVPGVGPNIDTEPYLLTKGEYVLNRRSVSKYGKDFLNKLNSGKIKTANTGSGPGGFSNLPNGDGFDLITKVFEELFSGITNTIIGSAKSAGKLLFKALGDTYKSIGSIRFMDKPGSAPANITGPNLDYVKELAGEFVSSMEKLGDNILKSSDNIRGKITKTSAGFSSAMSSFGERSSQAVSSLTKTLVSFGLPSIPKDNIRATHFTGQRVAEELLSGQPFKYKSDIISTTDSFTSNKDAAGLLTTGSVGSFDRSGFGDKVVLMDIPNEEYKKHANITKAPGQVENSRILGVFDRVTNLLTRNPNYNNSSSGGIKGFFGRISKKLSSLMSPKDIDAGSIFGPIVQNLSKETRDFIKSNYDYGEDKRGGTKRGVHRRYREGRKGFLGVSRGLDSDSTDFTAKHEVGHAVDRRAGLNTKAGFASATEGEIFNKIAMAFIRGDKDLKAKYAEAVSKHGDSPHSQIKDEAGRAKILKEVFANVFATSSDYQQKVLSSNTDQGAIDFIRSALADGGTKSDETNRILLQMLQELQSDNKGLPQQQGFVKGKQGFRRPSGRILDARQAADSEGIKTEKFPMIGPLYGPPPPPKTGIKDLLKSTIKSSFTFNKLATAAGLSAISLGAFASSSKEASDSVRLLIEALGGAVAVFTTASFAIAAAEKRISGGAGSGILGELSNKFGLSRIAKESGGVGATFNQQLKGIPDFLKRGVGQKIAMKAFNFVKGSGSILSSALAFGGSQYYSSLAEKTKDDLSKATSAEEVDAIFAKRKKYENRSGILSAVGGVLGGARAGALLGPKGAIIGGVLGGLTALGSSLKKTRLGKSLSNLFVKTGALIEKLIIPVVDGLANSFGKIIGIFDWLAASLTNPISDFIEWLTGEKPETVVQQEKFERDTALNEASMAKYVAAQNAAKPDGIGMSAQQYIAREGLGKALKRINDLVPNATEEQKSELKDQFTQVFNTVGGKTGGAEILKASGLSLQDVDRLNKELGASVNLVDQVSQLALEKSQQYFLRVTTLAEDLTNVITTAEQATNAFDKKIQTSLGKITSSKLDESVFGQIETGRQVVGPAYQDFSRLMARFRKFNRQAFADVNERIALERGKADVSRILSGLNEDNIKDAIRNTGGGSLDAQTFLIEELGKSLRFQGFGDEAVMKFQDVFETYLNQKSQELIEAAGETIKLSQLSEIVKGFDIDKGQIELLKAFEKSTSDFEDGMKDKIKSRLEIESKVNESLSKTLDTRKSLTEFLNRSIGGSKTGELTRSQAQQFESSRRAVQLRGTGLGAGASTQDIINRYRQVTRLESRSGVTAQTQFVKDALRSALESAAQGGEVMAKAMRDYESAAESAAKSAEKLSSALLGSDEEIINLSRGAEAFLRVQSGGLSSLMSLSSQEKGALKSYISGDESKTRVFENSIGIKAKTGPTPESARVREEFQKQLEAQNALTSINVDLSTNIGNLITEMAMNREAIIGFGVNMNKFAEATAQQAKNLTNMPTTVNHTLNVNPIVVSVNTQMDGIKSEELKREIVNTAVQKVAEQLSRDNPDLTINPIVPASTSTDSSASSGGLTVLH